MVETLGVSCPLKTSEMGSTLKKMSLFSKVILGKVMRILFQDQGGKHGNCLTRFTFPRKIGYRDGKLPYKRQGLK